MDLKDLYRDVILDHNKQPRNFGRLDPCDTSADGNNPLCGDRLTVTLRIAGGRVSDIRFEGKGCAISTASASLMTEAVKGLDAAQIHALHARAECGLGSAPWLHRFGGNGHQLVQSRHRIQAVAFLTARTLRFDDDHTISRDALV